MQSSFFDLLAQWAQLVAPQSGWQTYQSLMEDAECQHLMQAAHMDPLVVWCPVCNSTWTSAETVYENELARPFRDALN